MMLRVMMALLITYTGSVTAGELVRGGKLIEVASTSSNQNVFWVRVSGGVGPCADRGVTFPVIAAQSEAAFNRQFSIALAALAGGNEVRIHNYSSDECGGANFISIYPR